MSTTSHRKKKKNKNWTKKHRRVQPAVPSFDSKTVMLLTVFIILGIKGKLSPDVLEMIVRALG